MKRKKLFILIGLFLLLASASIAIYMFGRKKTQVTQEENYHAMLRIQSYIDSSRVYHQETEQLYSSLLKLCSSGDNYKSSMCAALREKSESSLAEDDKQEFIIRGFLDHPYLAAQSFIFVDRTMTELPLGNIAFNAPPHLYVGDSSIVNLNVSMKASTEELKKSIAKGLDKTEKQNVYGAKVKLNSRMRALLVGTRGIYVSSLDPLDEKEVPTDGQQWSWQIEAKESGPQVLTLVLTALVPVDGKDRSFPIQTFTKKIKVDVSPSRAVTDFLSKNWQFFWSTAVAPISIALWELWKALKEKKKAKSLIIRP